MEFNSKTFKELETLLKEINVELYDENDEIRSLIDVLNDLSKAYEKEVSEDLKDKISKQFTKTQE